MKINAFNTATFFTAKLIIPRWNRNGTAKSLMYSNIVNDRTKFFIRIKKSSTSLRQIANSWAVSFTKCSNSNQKLAYVNLWNKIFLLVVQDRFFKFAHLVSDHGQLLGATNAIWVPDEEVPRVKSLSGKFEKDNSLNFSVDKYLQNMYSVFKHRHQECVLGHFSENIKITFILICEKTHRFLS
jgi:hypothetical protein